MKCFLLIIFSFLGFVTFAQDKVLQKNADEFDEFGNPQGTMVTILVPQYILTNFR